MRIERISVSRIDPAPYNPRLDLKPGDPDYEKLARSIGEFGCVEPLVWNQRTGRLVGGHQRLKILIARGDAEVDVSVVDLDEAREKALNIALNRISGDWDQRRLAELLDELSRSADIDATLTGFDAVDIDELLASVLEPPAGEDPGALEIDEESEPVTQRGELIELGRHRLLCGDSSSPDDLERLLDGAAPDLLFTDPPYNVDYYGGDRPTPKQARPKACGHWKRIYADAQDQGEYEAWLERVLAGAVGALKPGAAIYIWNGHRQFGPMARILAELGAHVSTVITWAKERFAIGYGDYHQQTEFCLYGWRQGAAHRFHGPDNESTLWRVDRDPTREYVHPTQKPTELAERALRNSTRAGQLVLDCFLGSGTTLIAAEKTGRSCRGMEIDPRWCDAIVRRWLAVAGAQAPPELVAKYAPRDPGAAESASATDAQSTSGAPPEPPGEPRPRARRKTESKPKAPKRTGPVAAPSKRSRKPKSPTAAKRRKGAA